MNRSDFLKVLGIGTSGLIIPNTGNIWSQKAVKVYDNYVKGLNFYQFAKLKSQLKIGEPLHLKRETQNSYDSFAVEVYYQDKKLGYLAAYENIAIANMLEQGVAFSAFISKISSNPDKIFDGLAIEIYTNIVIQNQQIVETNLLDKRADDAHDHYRKGPFI